MVNTLEDMPQSGPFDPFSRPGLFAGVRMRRLCACVLDAIAILLLTMLAGFLIFLLGVFTFGLAWFMYLFLWQGVALLYTAFTLGGPNSATPGMRAFGLEMRLTNGERPYPLLAAIHALLFWFSLSFLTPLVLVVSLFSDRKRLLHDLVLGTVVINTNVQPQPSYG